ncbi:MAG: hypothetical protein J5621_01405 [Paludibacteraceae bacterium]|nr:hypothetical protein [Paludibacteraceae bacterium]
MQSIYKREIKESAHYRGVGAGTGIRGQKNKNKDVSASSSFSKKQEAEHTKNARPSTENKHQKGQDRKSHDKQGEKGDARRKRYK